MTGRVLIVTKNVKSMFNPKNRPSQQGERESRILISFPSGCCVLRKWAWWEWKPAVREFTTNVLSIGAWGGEEATKLSTNINWLTCRKFLTRFVVCLLAMVVGSSSDFRSWRPGVTGERSGLFFGPSKPQCFLYMKSKRFPFWSVIEASLFVRTFKNIPH